MRRHAEDRRQVAQPPLDQDGAPARGPALRDPGWASKLTEEGRRGLSPLFWSHVNPYGRFRLDMDTRLDLTAA
jgi:hypothetical protein